MPDDTSQLKEIGAAPARRSERSVNRWGMAVVLILIWGITASFLATFVILSLNMHVYLAGAAIAIVTLLGSIASLLARWYRLAFAFACAPGIVTIVGFGVLSVIAS